MEPVQPRAMCALALAIALGAAGARAQKPAQTPAPPAARLVLVHDGELLASESKALAQLHKRLAKLQPGSWRLNEASPHEVAALRAYLAGVPLPIPEEWRGEKTVIVLEVLAPSGEKPTRISSGLGALVVVRPPRNQPVYRERVDGRAQAPLDGDALADWIARATAVSTNGSQP
jgi:hypothetical protein